MEEGRENTKGKREEDERPGKQRPQGWRENFKNIKQEGKEKRDYNEKEQNKKEEEMWDKKEPED